MRSKSKFLFVWLGLVFAAGLEWFVPDSAQAAPFAPGNLLLTATVGGETPRLYEYTPSGTLVRTLLITNYDSGKVRDVAVDLDGNAQLFNGTFNPILTTFNSGTGLLTSNKYANWSSVGSPLGGKVAALGRFLFATDQLTGSDTQSDRGVVRFDLRSNRVQRFAARLGNITDIAAGLDGLLYVLVTSSSVYGHQIVIFNPETMESLRTVDLPTDYYAIAVDQAGQIYATGHDTNLAHYAANGSLINVLPLDYGFSISDLNVASNGLLVATLATGAVIVTSTTLAGNMSFAIPSIGSQQAYCTFGTIVQPPPATANATAGSLPGLLVATNSVWKYLDDGSDPGTAWRAIGFDDSNWLSGPARLGFSEGTESTVVRYGQNLDQQNITTYFRRPFLVANAWAVTNLQVVLQRKDGGVVYLNGTEIFRCNLTNDPVRSSSLAATNYFNTPRAFFTNRVEPALLVSGTNVLAVEIHLNVTNRSSIVFDLALIGEGIAALPACQLAASGTDLMLTWPTDPPGVVPYSTTNLSPGAIWSPLGNLPAAANGRFTMTLENNSRARYFRLEHP